MGLMYYHFATFYRTLETYDEVGLYVQGLHDKPVPSNNRAPIIFSYLFLFCSQKSHTTVADIVVVIFVPFSCGCNLDY